MILAAGRGLRLGDVGRVMPKGLLEVGGHTLIERSLAALRDAGIQRVVLVTGHSADAYLELAARLGDWITLVHNPDYATGGSLVSLMCVGPLQEPYLLVESDLLYQRRAPRLLVESLHHDVLLASGATGSGDEVYVGASDGCLVDLTKERSSLRGTYVGELVGLTRISPPLDTAIRRHGDRLLAQSQHVEYESALVAATADHRVSVLVVEDLVWGEIDDLRQLSRAVETVLPRL